MKENKSALLAYLQYILTIVYAYKTNTSQGKFWSCQPWNNHFVFMENYQESNTAHAAHLP